MKISAVMPVFNTRAIYLREAIQSVFDQTCPVCELIIIDDGSTRPETLEALYHIVYHTGLSFHPKIRFVSQKNKYISGALNTGIRLMDGDWWAGCPSDDRWLPSKIEKQVKFIKAYPEAKVIYSDWQFISHLGEVLEDYQEFSFKDRISAGKHIIREYIGAWGGMMIHRSVFDDIGLFNEAFPTREDYEFVVRILTKYMMYHIPKVLFQYRLHDEQTSTSTNLGTRSDDSRKYCEMARDLAIEHFGNEKDRKEFPLGREYRWGKQ